MGNKLLIVMISIGLILSIATVSLSTACAKQPETVLIRFSDHSPASGMRYDGVKWFINKVEKETAGRVKFEEYWNGTLATEDDNLQAAKGGVADLVSIAWGKHPSELPNWQVFPNIILFPDHRDRLALFEKFRAEIPELDADYAKLNQKVIGFHFLSHWAVVMRQPTKTTAELKGKTIRVATGAQAEQMRVLGALPVTLASSDVYTALQTGTIDGGTAHIEFIHRSKLYEQGKTLLAWNSIWTANEQVFSINLDTLNRMSPNDQKILLDAGKEMTKYFSDLLDKDLDTKIRPQISSVLQIIDVPVAEQVKWSNDPALLSLADKWSANNPSRSAIVKKVRDAVAGVLK